MTKQNKIVREIVNETALVKDWIEYHIKHGTIERDIYEQAPEIFQDKIFQSIQRVTGKTVDHKDRLYEEIRCRFWTLCEWLKYKKIYNLDATFARFLENTEDRPLDKELLKRLPFSSFYISWGERDDDSNGELGLSKTYGEFVRVMLVSEKIYIGLFLYGNSEKDPDMSGFSIVLPIPNGYNFSTESDSEQIGIKCWKPFLRIAFNTCQYLCAENAEVRPVKISKKNKPVVNLNGRIKPVSVEEYEVGYRLGRKFEKMYEEVSGETAEALNKKTWKQIRAHVRRAHWHHYWTGSGRANLIVKWLEPVFVMGNSEKIDVVGHKVEGNNYPTEHGNKDA